MSVQTIVAQVAEEFAEQKAQASHAEGIDPSLLRALWKANALEVLAFAMPRIGPIARGEDQPASPPG